MSRQSFETPARKEGSSSQFPDPNCDFRCPTPGEHGMHDHLTPLKFGLDDGPITVRAPRSLPSTISGEGSSFKNNKEPIYVSLPLPWFPYKFSIAVTENCSRLALLYIALPVCTLLCLPPLNFLFAFLHTITMRVLISFTATCFLVVSLFLFNIGYFLGLHILAFTMVSQSLPLLFVLHLHTRIQYYGLQSLLPSSVVRGIAPFFDRSLLDLTHLEWEGSSCMDVLALLLFNVEPEHRKHVLDRLPEGAQRLLSTKPYDLLPESVRNCLLPTYFGITPAPSVDEERFEAIARHYEAQRDNISQQSIMNEAHVQGDIACETAKQVWRNPVQKTPLLSTDSTHDGGTPVIGGRPMFVTPFRSHVHQILSAPCVPGPTFNPTTPLPFALASYGVAHLRRSVENFVQQRLPFLIQASDRVHAQKQNVSSILGDDQENCVNNDEDYACDNSENISNYAKVAVLTSTVLMTVRLLTSRSARDKVSCLVQQAGWATFTAATFIVIARAINIRVQHGQRQQPPSNQTGQKRFLFWATRGHGVEYTALLALTLWGALQARRKILPFQ